MIDDRIRFETAIQRFDAANAEDPRTVAVDGGEMPQELIYAQHMTRWLGQLVPDAPEPLQLAAHAQHIKRWEIPRNAYPEGRTGYHQWRTRLYQFHADVASEILRDVGYGEDLVQRVRDLLMKKQIKADPEMQALEDVICLVFLEHYFADFSRQHDEEKLLRIVRKTWRKMSPRGQEVAQQLELSEAARAVLAKALAES